MYLKKSILGQYEASFYKKTLQVNLLENGKPANPDVIASGIKETLALLPEGTQKEKDVTLVLPQEAFVYMKCNMPADIAENALPSYLKDKVRTEKSFDPESGHFDFIIRENEGAKKVVFYGASNETVDAFADPLKLIELNLACIVPESLTYFKLFEKTLRTNKKENIWYVSYDQDQLAGYVYDSYGLIEDSRWKAAITETKKIEKVLQKKVSEYEAAEIKLNRLILSGAQSESVRQDTFTKNVGVWTNPLKRIIPHFYADYLKMLAGQEGKEIPVLEYDMLIGAFIFNTENKPFTLMNGTKKQSGGMRMSKPSMSMPKLSLPITPQQLIVSVLSFSITFGILYGVSRFNNGFMAFKMPSFNFSIPGLAQATPTPTPLPPTPAPPTPTPTPEINRAEVRVSVQNGSGIAGKASDVKSFLQDQGYEDILTANADSFDYETTVIQTKEGDESLRDMVAADISTEIEDTPVLEPLDEDAAADVVIIVGTDFR